MKIDKKEAYAIIMTHSATGMSFANTLPPEFRPVSDEYVAREIARIWFEFNDLAEVDRLIQMLEMFRDKCDSSFGKWRGRVSDD